MARVVRAVGPTADTKTLDIVEQQVLVEMEDADEQWHVHLLHYRLGAGRWVTSDADGFLDVDDLSELDVVPLSRNAAYPVDGRPFRVTAALTAAALDSLRARARQMAEIHGWVAPVGTAAGVAGAGIDGWFHSDTGTDVFGKEVNAAVLTNPAHLKAEGNVALVYLDLSDSLGPRWTTAERVLRSDLADWLAAKRSGAGRDPRLLLRDKKPDGRAVLLRDVARNMDTTASPSTQIFAGPSALAEIIRSVESSGLEFIGWGAQYVSTSGIGAQSGLAREFSQHVYTLHYMHCIDGLDGGHLASAEHVARRMLQIQKAVKRNPKSPDFDSLEAYTRHMVDSTGSAFTPVFDKHVAEIQRASAVTLKQDRLNREEAEHEKERQKGKKGKEKDA